MGWCSGSELFDAVIQALKADVPEADARKRIYKKLIAAFQNQDWDTEDECMGQDPAFDAAYTEMHPRRFGDP